MDCEPDNGETVIEITRPANANGEHTFFAYWNDGTVIRSQLFVTDLASFVAPASHVRFVDRRKQKD